NRAGGALRRQETTFLVERVWAWELTGDQRAAVEQSRIKMARGGTPGIELRHYRAMAVLYGLRDSGEPGARQIFVDGDEGYLNELPASELDKAAELVAELSGMRSQDAEEARKNSGAAAGSGPSSTSPTADGGPPSAGGSEGSAAAS